MTILLVYIALPTKDYYWDGIWFAQTIEDAKSWPALLHPNHLVYNALGYAVYHLLGSSLRSLYILQAIDVVASTVTAYVLFGILCDISESEETSLLLTGLFAFSGTWWRFSTDADAYIPSVCLLVVCTSLLIRRNEQHVVSAAVLHWGAMLVHELAVLFFPAALLALWHQGLERERRLRLLRLVQYCGIVGGLTLISYFLGFAAYTGSVDPRAFWRWTTSHSQDVAFSFDLARNALITLRSWIQLLAVGRLTLIRWSEPVTLFLLALLLVILFFLIAEVSRAHWSWRVKVRQGALFQVALLWLGGYFVFLFFWLPQNTFYKLFALPAIVLLFASCITPEPDRRAPRPLMWAVALLAACNLTFGIIPYSRVDSNQPIAFAIGLKGRLRPGSVVQYSSFNADDWFVRYFNPQTEWRRAGGSAGIDADLETGRDVWLETTAVELFAKTAPAWLADRTAGADWCELINRQHRIRFVHLRPPHGR